MPLFHGSSRFESLISFHHSKGACECNKEDINDDDDDGGSDLEKGRSFDDDLAYEEVSYSRRIDLYIAKLYKFETRKEEEEEGVRTWRRATFSMTPKFRLEPIAMDNVCTRIV